MEEMILTYDAARKLADKQRMTANEKAAIEEAAQEYGIALNKKCSSCYRDAASQIALKLRTNDEPQEGEYELCEGIDITLHSFRFGAMHICAQNCNAENARKWIAAGIPMKYFKKYPHADNK